MGKNKNKLLTYVILAVFSLLGACNMKKDEPAQPVQEAERHAFMLENDFIFIADVPKNWRYILYPVCNYGYYAQYNFENDTNKKYSHQGQTYVKFIGLGGKEGGRDNYFAITASSKENSPGFSIMDDGAASPYVPFIFRDGIQGQRENKIWEDGDHIKYYESSIYDIEEKYCLMLTMLEDEYNANEPSITEFLESTCFRTSDLGISGEEDILKRELLTLHIWSPYVQLSLEVPEGAEMGYKIRPRWEGGGEICLYYIYLDKEKDKYIEIEPDPDGWYVDPTGDFHYFLNQEDFMETVYEIPKNYVTPGGYYFVRKNVALWVNVDQEDTEMREYAKKIVQSVQFE
ncbi:MAG: hypothetical protein K2N63_15035 [Lachnospiraceae bacterium]|nr:hypothetical protein [Lachnospiraceae bacterium]